MQSVAGEIIVVFLPYETAFYGRNAIASRGRALQELVYLEGSNEPSTANCDGGAEIKKLKTCSVILSRAVERGYWGAESGSNENDVTIGIAFSNEIFKSESSIEATDLVRLCLESASSSENGLEMAISLLNRHGIDDETKMSLVFCDSREAWILNIAGKYWVAERINSDYKLISPMGFTITNKFDRSSDNLKTALKESNLWSGENEFNFTTIFFPNNQDDTWTAPSLNAGTVVDDIKMFEFLRLSKGKIALSSHVSAWLNTKKSCNWFTATPNTIESVFKPFIFTPKARISELAKSVDGIAETKLQKLHAQRDWKNVGNLLKSLESSCVNEVKSFLAAHATTDQELDDLLKDCVEAEVKFYR